MGLNPILPTTAATDITFGGTPVSYKAVVNSYNIATDRNRFNGTTFDNENDGMAYYYGSNEYTATLTGLQYEGDATAGLGIGIERFDGQAFEITANTNSTVSGTANPSRGSTGRDAGSVGSDSITFNASGVTVAWDRGTT